MATLCFILPAATAAGAILSPETGVTNPVPVESLGTEYKPAVACGNTTCLAVWERSPIGGSGSIQAARIASDGTVSPSVEIGPGGVPVIAWTGEAYVVAWGAGSGASTFIQTRQISESGVLGPVTQFAQSNEPLLDLAVSSRGGITLLTWIGGYQRDLRGARMSAEGTLLDPSGFTICAAVGNQSEPSVGASATQFLVAWTDARAAPGTGDVYAARVSQGGVVLDPDGHLLSAGNGVETGARVASDGSNFMVVWTDTSRGNADVRGTAVDPDAHLLSPGGRPIRNTPDSESAAGLTFTNTSYVVAWQQPTAGGNASSILAEQIFGDGDPAGSPFSVAADTGAGDDQAMVAPRGEGFAVVWRDASASTTAAKLRRFASDTTAVDASALTASIGANYQDKPAISFDGTNYLVAYLDRRDTGTTADLRAARVSPGGTVLDPAGILIASGVQISGAKILSAWNGSAHLIVWHDNGDIRGRRVSSAGALLDAGPIAIATAQGLSERDPAITQGGNNGWLVAWTAGDPSISTVQTVRISSAGALTGYAVIASDPDYPNRRPAVGYNGASYLIAWYAGPPGNVFVYTRQMSPPNGSLTTPFFVDTGSEGPIAIAAAGTSEWLVGYTSGTSILGQRIFNGAKTGNATVIGDNYYVDSPFSLAYDGVYWDVTNLSYNGQMYVGYLTATLGEVDSALLPATYDATLVAGPFATVGVAYTRWADEAPYHGAQRLFMRTVESYALKVSAIAPVTEGGVMDITVTLTPARPDKNVTVDYAVTDATGLPGFNSASATAGKDFVAAGGTLTFGPGQTSTQVHVPTYDDALDEIDPEYIGFTLSNASGADLPLNRSVYGPISDNDPSPTITVADATVAESAGSPQVDVQLSAVSGRDVTATLHPVAGTATAADFTLPNTVNVTLPAGQTHALVAVPITADVLDEPDESFKLQVQSATGAVAGPDGTVTITDDDAPPSIGVGAVQVDEGDGSVDVPITLSAPSGFTVTATVNTSDGSAHAPGDYAAAAGVTVTFPPGSTLQDVPLGVAGDALDEADETFAVTLSAPSHATLGTATANVTIVDDDGPSVTVGDVSAAEGAGTLSFPIGLSAPSPQEITGSCSTTDGSAAAGADYTARSAPFSVPAGAAGGSFAVDIAGDAFDEADETLTLTCTVGSAATLADGQATGTITDDDATPAVSVAAAQVSEGDSASKSVDLPVHLAAPSGRVVTVGLSTADGTAVAPGDYTAVSGAVVTFLPGETDKSVAVSVAGDTLDELDETFSVTLSGPVNATLGTAASTVKILDDDDGPVAAIPMLSAVDATVSEGETASVRLELSAPSTQTVTVRARTIDGSATAPADYAAVDTVVSFAPGELVKSVSVTTATDALAEPAESLGVALSEAAGASVARDALVTIADRAGTAGGGTSGSTDGAGTGTKTPAAGVTIGAGTLRLDKHGRMHVALACPAEPTAPACRGTLTVASAAKVRVGKKRSILDLGKATFTIPRGATVKVAVTLSHRNLLVVRRLHSLRVALVAGDTRRVVPLFRYAKGG